MPERIFIGVAWPYANGDLHTGHIAGCYLPGDIFARYHRMKGNQVLMVSGTDAHGTPNTVRAAEEGVSTQVIVDRYHTSFLKTWEELGISWDLYTSTQTENHTKVTQEVFLRLLERDHLYKDTMSLPFCPKESRFLPDRYVLGTCPRCGSTGARGDECDACGHPLEPFDLIEPRCRFCGTTPVPKDSEHFFLRLSSFTDQLHTWVKAQTHWRPNVYNFTLRYLEDGLHDRAITRDMDWGIPIPLAGYESKRFYVWFENIIGYLSASKEWAQQRGEPEAWRDFWEGGKARGYYFIGKDNIFFHTLSWPAEILGYGELDLPYDVPANEFMNLEGQKISTSRNWAVWLPDYLERYAPDPLRYYLSANMPEGADADFSWREFLRRNNNELVATYGNLVHRVLTITYRNFDGRVPEPGPLDDADRALLQEAQGTLQEVDRSLGLCRFREAIGRAMALAGEANRYIDAKAPWRTVTENRSTAAATLWTALQVISALKTALAPFLPFSSARLHTLLGLPGGVQDGGWQLQPLTAGQPLGEPAPLFAKLDEAVVEEETRRLEAQRTQV